MRQQSDMLDLHPSLVGTIRCTGITAVGAPIDTLGFAEVLGVLMAGGSFGTGGNAGSLAVKVQESASPTGTGALWTDITDGVNGSFAFAAVTIADATSPIMYMGTRYEQLANGKRARYIRAHATMTGTDACNPKIAVGFLLGRPSDTLYVARAVTQATGNNQFALGR